MKFRLNKDQEKNFMSKGFIALMTTLIISFILLSGVLTINFESFQVLMNVWQRHSKELSFSLAQSCVDQAIVRVLQNPSYQTLNTGELIKIKNFSCLIKEVLREEDEMFLIKSEAEVYKTFTSLEVVFDARNLEIVSFTEV